MNESQWSAKIRKRTKELFENAVVFKLSTPYIAALPDSAYIYSGMTTWVEVKREYNKPTEIQKLTMRLLYEQNGGRAYFIRIMDKSKPVQFEIRSGHDWEVLINHNSTLDTVVRYIVQWRD